MGQAYADIEDLFDKEEYLVLFNGAFGKSVQISELDTNKPIMSQLKRLNGNKALTIIHLQIIWLRILVALYFQTKQ